MNATHVAALITGLLLASMVAPLAASDVPPTTTPSHPMGSPTGGPGRPTAGPAQAAEHDRSDWQNLSQTQKVAGLARADAHRLFAEFQYANGVATGRYVSFGLDAATGVITQFQVKEANASYGFFDRAAPTPFTAGQTPFVTGSVLHVDAANFSLMAHNNPTAMVTWMSGTNGTTLTFALGSGVTTNASGKEVKLLLGTRHGHLLTNGNQTPVVNGNQVTFQVNAGELVMFRFHPSGRIDAASLHEQNAAVTSGRLGAVIHVADAGGVPVEDRQETGVSAKTTHIQSGQLHLQADSANPSGRVLFITVDGGTLNASRIDEIRVTISGAAAARLAKISDVLASTNASVSIVAADGNVQLAINVPHFSTQTVAVDQNAATNGPGATGGSSGTPAPGLVWAACVVAAIAWVSRRTR